MSDPSTESTSSPQEIARELAAFHIFKGIPLEELELLNATKPRPVRRGVTLFRQGDVLPRIFLIQKGQIELVHVDKRGRKLRRVVGPGQVLGRLELDVAEGQLGTAKTLTPVQFIIVDIASLTRLRNRFPKLQSKFDRSDVIGHLRGNPYFAPLNDFEIKWISDIVVVDNMEPGEVIYHQGEAPENVVIIRQGRVRLDSELDRHWVSAGSVIGYQEIIAARPYAHTATIENKTQLFFLPKDDFLAVIRRHPRHDWTSPPVAVEELLKQAPLFRTCTDEDIRLLAGYVMQLHHHTAHQTIVRAGKLDNYYYILARGSALLQTVDSNDQVISSVTIVRGASFGERSLLFGDPAENTVETLEPTNWIRIHRLDFQLYMAANPGVRERLSLSDELRERLAKRVHQSSWQREDEEILSMRRRHWIVLVRHLGIVFLLLFIQFIIAAIFRVLFHDWHVGLNLLIAALYALPMTIWIVLDYSNDYHIITTRRVVHQEKIIFIKERRTSAPIEQIQEVSIDRDMLAKLLRYGDLVIKTAATEGDLRFDYHPDPVRAHEILIREMTRLKKFALAEQQETIQKQLQERLHLGLEERIDERALMDPIRPRKIKQPKRLPVIGLLGLQEEPGNRLVWRRHWFGLILTTLPAFLATFASVVLLVILASGLIFPSTSQGLRAFFVFLSLVAVAVSMFWLWWQWEDWENDRYIVSDQLIERISKKPLWFDEERISLNIERVQNVDFKRPNPLAYLFNFGDVNIQTAAADGKVTFEFVPAPDEVQFEIFHRIRDYQENLEKMRQKEQKNDFVEWLEAYHKLVTHEQHPENNL